MPVGFCPRSVDSCLDIVAGLLLVSKGLHRKVPANEKLPWSFVIQPIKDTSQHLFRPSKFASSLYLISDASHSHLYSLCTAQQLGATICGL